MNSFSLEKKIRSKAVARICLSFVFILAGVLYMVLMASYGLFSMLGFFDPISLNDAPGELDRLSRSLFPKSTSIVLTAEGDDIIDVGIESIYLKTSSMEGKYFAVPLEGRYILCLMEKEISRNSLSSSTFSFKGVLMPIDKEVHEIMITEMTEAGFDRQEAYNSLCSMIINTNVESGVVYRLFNYTAALVLFVLGNLYMIRNLSVIFNVCRDKGLAVYLLSDKIFSDVDKAYSDMGNDSKYPLGGISRAVYLLDFWIIRETLFGMRYYSSSELMWVYKSHFLGMKMNHVPTMLVLHVKDWVIKLYGKEAMIDEILHAVAQRYPWVMVGYSGQLERLWKSDREQFIKVARHNSVATV